MATTCIQTKVRNTSGKTRSFGFIPPHGKRMTAGQEIWVDGDIWDRLKNERQRKALKDALNDGTIVLMESPKGRHYDDTLDNVKVLGVDNGSVTVNDPCEGAFSSSIGD